MKWKKKLNFSSHSSLWVWWFTPVISATLEAQEDSPVRPALGKSAKSYLKNN
jgi:hypothetical protein